MTALFTRKRYVSKVRCEGNALSAEMGKVLNGKLYHPKTLASGEVAVNQVLFTKNDLVGATKVAYDFSATSGKAGYILLYKEEASSYYQRIGKTSGASGALDYSGTIDIPDDFDRAVWGGTASGTIQTLSCTVLKDDEILHDVDVMADRLEKNLEETVSLEPGYYASEEILTVGLDIAVGDILNYDFEVESGEIGVIKFVASDGTLVSQIGKTSTSGSTLAFSGSVAIPANTAFVRVLNITINSLTYTKSRIFALEQYQAINNAKYVPFANKLVCDNDDINQVLTGLYITNKDIIADLDNITSIEIYGGTGASAAARPLAGIIFNGTNEIRCYYENNDASQLTKYMAHVFYCNGVFAVIDWSRLQKWPNTASLKYIERAVTLNTSVVTDVASNPIIEAYIGRTTINRDYKLISFAGDSITYGLKDEADGGGQWVAFPSLVGDALQIKTMNYGVPSATCMISSTLGQRSWCRDYTVIRDDSDIVAMMIGINDCYRDYPLGTMSDRTTDTFYGALHVMWQALLNRFPPKNNKRLFMIDYFEIDEEPIATTTWQSFVQAQREVAEYYSIPICYLSKELGITPQMDTNYEYWGEWTPAGTHSPHPKQSAHDAIARVVASWIKAHFG